MRIVNRGTATIDYRLHRRHMGVRVWKDRCQIIARFGVEWTTVGPQLELPLGVPSSMVDLRPSEDASNTVRSAAFRYELEQPGSDLFAVLMKETTFEKAMLAA